ncbi:MAG TPA: hypothetical protein VFJ82_04090 [Longimicrobium sp.]|nr:hypothetical protein [Longimicrobium sp.]
MTEVDGLFPGLPSQGAPPREAEPGAALAREGTGAASEASSFIDALRGIAGELREGGHTHTALNRASSAVDLLGRRLHGLGFARASEIAECFTGVLADLDASHRLPERGRRDAVRRAVGRLEDALEHAAAGVPPSAR